MSCSGICGILAETERTYKEMEGPTNYKKMEGGGGGVIERPC